MGFLYERAVRPAAFLLDPENTHKTALFLAEKMSPRFIRAFYYHHDPANEVTAGSIRYPSVVGIAAGYDKYGQMLDSAQHFSAGHLEWGTLTPEEREGNPRPRLFRDDYDKALVNRMGLNNYGLLKSADLVRNRTFDFPINVSFDPNVFFVEDTIKDTEEMIQVMGARHDLWMIPYAKILNISCPNTSDGKAYSAPKKLDELLTHTDKRESRDLYVKFSHDHTNHGLGELIDACNDHRVTGFVISNTTTVDVEKGKAGMSGGPLVERNLEMVNYAKKKSPKKVVIGTGGIGCDPLSDPEYDTFRYLSAGADMVQVFTGIAYSGPGIFKRINKRLGEWLEPYGSVDEFIRRRDL